MRLSFDVKSDFVRGITAVSDRAFEWSIQQASAGEITRNVDQGRVYVDQPDPIRAFGIVVPRIDAEHIWAFAVDPPFQGQGLGNQLLSEMIADSYDDMTLNVKASNVPAIRLYKKFGFEVTKRLVDWYLEEGDGLHMRRSYVPRIEL